MTRRTALERAAPHRTALYLWEGGLCANLRIINVNLSRDDMYELYDLLRLFSFSRDQRNLPEFSKPCTILF